MQVPTLIHNIIVGTLWADQHGTMVITNHATGDIATLKYTPYSYFSSSEARRVSGPITDRAGKVLCLIDGELPAVAALPFDFCAGVV